MQLTLGLIAFATFLWWFSTGVIFYLNARPAHTFRWSLAGASVVLAGAIYGLWASAGETTTAAALVAFTCGVVVWGWHTMSYYMGVVTGPRREPCPEACSGPERFLNALATSIYHELAIVATAVLLGWMTWGQPNRVGFWTFLLLWTMHVSAKLNVFLGVRNLNTEFIPKRLDYLTTYFRKKSMNLLFPVSVTAGTVVAVLLAERAGSAVDPLIATGSLLLATLMTLAVIEHWFMILPIPAEALWRWSLRRSERELASRATIGAEPVRRDRSTSNERSRVVLGEGPRALDTPSSSVG